MSHEAIVAERDRLQDVIDRAADRLAELESLPMPGWIGDMDAASLELALSRSLDAMYGARAILAEADPGDPGE